MSNAGAGAQQSSAQTLDANLWWDSHVQFFNALDKNISCEQVASRRPDRESSTDALSTDAQKLRQEESMAGLLVGRHLWLLNTLSFFKPPNQKSRASLNSSQIGINSHTLEIKPTIRDLALQVSLQLALDEVQAYILLTRHFESGVEVPDCADSKLLVALLTSYYLERQCLLKCTRLLLTIQMAEESIQVCSQEVSQEVRRLISDGLEDKILIQLKDSLRAEQPTTLGREFRDFWAEEVALEQTLILDILFLLYYEPLCVCKGPRLKELLTTFEDLVFGRSKERKFALTSESEKYLKHARHQSVLIIIEALDLENLLLMVHSELPFSQGGHGLTMEDLQGVDGIMSTLDITSAPECGPLLLAWATFLCLVSFLPSENGRSSLWEVEHTLYVQQAYDAGAYNYLLDMLHDEFFQEAYIQVGGYKSIMKTLMAAFIAAYDFVFQMTVEGYDVLISIFSEIYRNQEALCLELWDRDSVIDGPIRNLFFSLRDSFPYQTLPLVRLLATQCEGLWPTECAYDFLYQMVEITSLYQFDEVSVRNESGTMVQTRKTLQIPDAPGLLIPAGTSGFILNDFGDGVSLVRWECKHSGMVVLLIRALQRSLTGYQLDEVCASLHLINRMLSSNKALSQLLLDLNDAVVTVNARSDGRMEPSLRIDPVSMICSMVNTLVHTTGSEVMVASCIGILSSFAICCPAEVMAELSQAVLMQSADSISSLSNEDPGSLLHVLKTEQMSGQYPLTIAVLDFIRVLVEKGVDTEPLASLVTHVLRSLFVNHGNWKYQQISDRWMISTKVLLLMRSVVKIIFLGKDVGWFKGVLETLLNDCIIHNVFLSILVVNAHGLEELHFNRTVSLKEIEWLQQSIHTLFMLVHDLARAINVAGYFKHDGIPQLHQTFLRKSAGSRPAVAEIATFLGFSRNGDLQLASAKALTGLVFLAQKLGSHSLSIGSYISSNEQKFLLQHAVGELLSEEMASSSCEVFNAVVDLLTAAVKWQPALVEHFLFPIKQSEECPVISKPQFAAKGGAHIQENNQASEALNVLWKFVANSSRLVNSHPQALSRVLFLLSALWEGGIEYLAIIEELRNRKDFWKSLTSCLSYCSVSGSTIPTILSNIKSSLNSEQGLLSGISRDSMVMFAFQYACEASVLSIMTHDIFLQHLLQGGEGKLSGVLERGDTRDDVHKSTVTSSESGALKIVCEWGHISTITNSYASSLHDRELLLRSKAEVRLLVVGLMGKVLAKDTRGFSASLIARLDEASQQMIQHPSFEDLSNHYSSQGYSYDEDNSTMVVCDLFHHLQGELDGGRPIPTGSFQQVAEFLLNTELLYSVRATQVLDLHPWYGYSFLHDFEALEAELGTEWWTNGSSRVLGVHVVESALANIQHVNAMASLAHSQLSALRAWTALLTISIFDSHKGFSSSLATVDWPDVKLEEYYTELVIALEGAISGTQNVGDAVDYTYSFMGSQIQLLLSFIRWLCNRKWAVSQTTNLVKMCAKLIGTVIRSLRKLLDSQYLLLQHKENLVKSLLGALLLLLELMHSQKSEINHTKKPVDSISKEIGDAFADVTVVSLSFLPLLCQAVEKHDYADICLAVINLLIKGFLGPSPWFPVLEQNFPTATALSRMYVDANGGDSTKVMLKMCLSLVHLKGGAELLHSAGFFSHLQMLGHHMRDDVSFTVGDTHGPFNVWVKSAQREGPWGLCVAIVTALVQSLGEKDLSGGVVENALSYISLQKERVLCALRAPMSAVDFQGRNNSKFQCPRTSLSALQETQHVVALICEVSQHQARWTGALQNYTSKLEEMAVHLLAFIAREGLVRQGSSVRSGTGAGFSCHPLLKEEFKAHSKPSIVSSNCAWFAVCARGCAVEMKMVSATSQISSSPSHSLNFSPTRRSPSFLNTMPSSRSSIPCSEYSDMVAIHIYRLAFLLLKFICQQAQLSIHRVQEGRPPDYNNFPELPAPEILHGVQDQVLSIVTEICGGVPSRPAQDVCCLLLVLMEMTFYLEIFIARTCGFGPVPLRSDDFAKDYKLMLLAGHAHSFLESPLQSLKRVVAIALPGLL